MFRVRTQSCASVSFCWFLVRWGARRYRSCACSWALRGCYAFWAYGVLKCSATHTTHINRCLLSLPFGSRVLGLVSQVFGSSWLISGSCSLLVMGPDNGGELRYKKMPTPCLWQAPASTQKTKRKTGAEPFYCFSLTIKSFRRFDCFTKATKSFRHKTKPAIRRGARWRASLPWVLP